MSYIDRYINLFADRNEKIEIIDHSIYRVYNKMIIPFGPVKFNYQLSEQDICKLFSSLNGIMVRWTNHFEQNNELPWYAVICDDFKSIEVLSSKQRNEINRGLANCQVRRIDAEYLSKYGFEPYRHAILKYKNYRNVVPSEQEFKKNILSSSKYEDIVHYWGVFYKEKLIAYSSNYLFDNVECAYSSIKFHPGYMNYYPSYALMYTMNEYYLKLNHFQYVNDGFRSIFHETNVQHYLINKFNFKKQYMQLHVKFKQPYAQFIKLTYPFKAVAKIGSKRLYALYELENISRCSDE